MNNNLCIQITPNDNVVIAVKNVDKGTEILPDVITLDAIPQAHKIAITDILKGEPIIKYGVILGYAKNDIKKGAWIDEKMVILPKAPLPENIKINTTYEGRKIPIDSSITWEGYKNSDGYAGTRNILGITTTVQCVTGVLNRAVEKIKTEILPKYKNVDGVVAINHAYGCGVAINAENADIPIRIIKNLSKHPNFGGQLMVVGLGCEKLTVDMLCDKTDITPENIIILQEKKGYVDMINSIVSMAEKKLQILNMRKRETLPLSDLIIGMQCGGSDAFSGVTANPAAGYAADKLVANGATVLFSEVTEVRDGIQILGERCSDQETLNKLCNEMKWYDNYLDVGKVDRDANPTPGNKKGGLANIVEKAMGSIAKSGTAKIVQVLSPGEKPTKKGLIYAATPASDMVCGTCQLASGIGLQLFMTGRGTPYGLAMAPVIKICSRTEMKNQWDDLIDINAGPIATGETSIEDMGEIIFNKILDVASGREQSLAEKYKLYNDFCVFNPAPIT